MMLSMNSFTLDIVMAGICKKEAFVTALPKISPPVYLQSDCPSAA